MSDTIAAIATAPGPSAIGVVRLSGPDTCTVLDRVFRPKNGRPMSRQEPRRLVLGDVLDRDGQVIDSALAVLFPGPGSYTGQDCGELQCHGSPVVLDAALAAMLAAGARQAKGGEFTRRAFLNGRMDLLQAEAVADLIDAETAQAAHNAVGQLEGVLSRTVTEIYDGLMAIVSRFYAVVDYPDEDIGDLQREDMLDTLRRAENRLEELLATFSRGKLLKLGVPTVILGRPNVGKSSLLNALLGYDRAIVTDVAGTTRDTVEEKVRVGHVLLRLCDTAGIHQTEDAVEKIGVERARAAARQASLALLVLENPIRPNAPKVFDYFHTQGVDVKVISGDNPVTVSAVAAQAGIRNAEQWVDARELQTDQDIAAAVREYTVFGRVVPNQKRKIVRALQSQGHTVAMTGDGVNDVLALKDADCGVAMASGADAACQVAQLVLLDSDFAAMPKVVAEGRRVINNIQRASALYLVKNILSFFLALITLFAAFPYPFVPIQLTLISALTIGVPSFFLALEPNHDLVKGKFLHNVLRRAFPGGLTAIFVILFAELFVYTFDLTLAELSTICVILMAVNGLMVIYYAARPLDAKRLVLLVAMSAAMFVAVVFYGAFFSLSSLSFAAWLVLIVLVLLVVPIQMGLEWCFDRCTTALDRRRERLAKRRRAPRRPRPAHRSRRRR